MTRPTFVTSFFDLHSFRDTPSAYINSFRLLSRLPNLICYCGTSECAALRAAAEEMTNPPPTVGIATATIGGGRGRAGGAMNGSAPMFVIARLEETPLWRDHYERFTAAVRSMFRKPRLSAAERRRSQLLRKGGRHVETYIQYMLLTHAKVHWLMRAAASNPYGSEYIVWADAGLYRYQKHVVGANVDALGCYATPRARFPIDASSPAWPSREESLYLVKPSREVLATLMGFNASYLVNDFGPRYFRRVEELLARGESSTEQGVLTLMASERPGEFELVETDNYRYIARKMINCP